MLRELDERVALAARDTTTAGLAARIALALERAAVTGDLDDLQLALTLSDRQLAELPDQTETWLVRAQALGRVHRFAEAKAALAKVRAREANLGDSLDPMIATLAEATGDLATARPIREQQARDWPRAENLVMLAGDQALAGDLDGALATMTRAHQALKFSTAIPLAWMLFQWGRLHEQRGESAAARAFYQEALARLPGYLEPRAHLAQLLIAAGDRDAAAALLDPAHDRHPELLGLAATLAATADRPARLATAKAAWERYLAALPEAFADHGARFYLGVGADPVRALALARLNLANRDTHEARALLVEAALAAGDKPAACDAAGPLVAAPALRAYRFLAWRALTACGRPEAAALGRELGI
jgi:tetratricopeptide (TPR) repeat protein